MIKLVVILSLTVLQGVLTQYSCHQKEILPGLDMLLSTVNILNPIAEPGPRLFKLPNVTSSKCPYVIPDNVLVGEEYSCHLVPQTHILWSPKDLSFSVSSACPAFDYLAGS